VLNLNEHCVRLSATCRGSIQARDWHMHCSRSLISLFSESMHACKPCFDLVITIVSTDEKNCMEQDSRHRTFIVVFSNAGWGLQVEGCFVPQGSFIRFYRAVKRDRVSGRGIRRSWGAVSAPRVSVPHGVWDQRGGCAAVAARGVLCTVTPPRAASLLEVHRLYLRGTVSAALFSVRACSLCAVCACVVADAVHSGFVLGFLRVCTTRLRNL
jgi:hypothetical protein